MAVGDGLRRLWGGGRGDWRGRRATPAPPTPRSNTPGSRPRRWDTVPLSEQFRVRSEEPVYRAPPRPRLATRPEQIRPLLSGLLAREEQTAYGAASMSMLEYQKQRFAALQAKTAEIDAASQAKQVEEGAHRDYQDLHADALMQTLRPNTASVTYLQAIAFRGGDKPLSMMEEEAREAEGQSRFRRYMDWYNNAEPEEQQTQAAFKIALLKEGMDAEKYDDILEASKRGDDSVYRYQRDDRRAANRILQTTLTDRIPGTVYQDTGDRSNMPRIPTAEKPEEEDDGGFLDKLGGGIKAVGERAALVSEGFVEGAQKGYGESPRAKQFVESIQDADFVGGARDIATGVGRTGLEAVTGRKAVGRLLEGDIRGAVTEHFGEMFGGVEQAFKGEQELVTPFTRPAIRQYMEAPGLREMPDDWKDTVAKYGAEFVVPSSLIGAPTAKGANLATRFGRRAAVEGTINMLQDRAGRAARGEKAPEPWESAMIFAGGAFVAGAAPEVLKAVPFAAQKTFSILPVDTQDALRGGASISSDATRNLWRNFRATMSLTGSERGALQLGPSPREIPPERAAGIEDAFARGDVELVDVPVRESFFLPDGRWAQGSEEVILSGEGKMGGHEEILERLGYLKRTPPGALDRPYEETSLAYAEMYDSGGVRFGPGYLGDIPNLTSHNIDAMEAAVASLARVAPDMKLRVEVIPAGGKLDDLISVNDTARNIAARGLKPQEVPGRPLERQIGGGLTKEEKNVGRGFGDRPVGEMSMAERAAMFGKRAREAVTGGEEGAVRFGKEQNPVTEEDFLRPIDEPEALVPGRAPGKLREVGEDKTLTSSVLVSKVRQKVDKLDELDTNFGDDTLEDMSDAAVAALGTKVQQAELGISELTRRAAKGDTIAREFLDLDEPTTVLDALKSKLRRVGRALGGEEGAARIPGGQKEIDRALAERGTDFERQRANLVANIKKAKPGSRNRQGLEEQLAKIDAEIPARPNGPPTGGAPDLTHRISKRLQNGTPVARKSTPNTPLGTIKSSVKGTKQVWVATPSGGRTIKINRDKLVASQAAQEGAKGVSARTGRIPDEKLATGGAEQPPVSPELHAALHPEEAAAPPTKPPRKPPSGAAPEQLDFTLHPTRLKKGQDSFEKLGTIFRSSKGYTPEAEATMAARRSKRTAAMGREISKIEQSPTRKSSQVLTARSALRGELKPPVRKPVRHLFTEDELLAQEDALHALYPKANQRYTFENAVEARDRLFDGYSLSKSERKLLAPIIPKKVLEELQKEGASLLSRIGSEAYAIAFTPMRALLSTWDNSILGRQLFLFAPMHPRAYASTVKETFKALFTPGAKRGVRVRTALADRIVNDPLYRKLVDDFKLPIDEIEYLSTEGAAKGGKTPEITERFLTAGEDTYTEKLLEKVPFVQRSQDVYSLGLANSRLRAGKDIYTSMHAAGKTTQEIQDVLDTMLAITGRGKLPGSLAAHTRALSLLFYAPRLFAAHVQVPLTLLTGGTGHSAAARWYAGKALLRGTGMAAGMLGLAAAADLAVELDPRSSDWGKVKIGNTRVDVTGGYGPLIRFFSRISSQGATEAGVPGFKGGYKNPLGEVSDLDVRNAVESIIESKLSPTAGLIFDIQQGKTFTGEKLRADWDVVKREAYNRGVPLIVQSMVDAYRQGGGDLAQMALASSEFVGFSAQSYEAPTLQIADALADDIQRGLIPDIEEYKEELGHYPRTRSELHPKDSYDFSKRHEALLEKIAATYDDDELTAETAALTEAREISKRGKDTLVKSSALVDSGDATLADFRETLTTVQSDSRAQREIITNILAAADFPEDERPETPGIMQDLYDYGLIFDQYPDADADPAQKDAMFNAIEDFRNKLGSEREARLDANMNLVYKEVPLYVEYQEDKRVINDSGYFDRVDDVWNEVRAKAADRGMTLPPTRDKHERDLEADGEIPSGDRWIRYADYVSDHHFYNWKRDNPNALGLVIKWGYQDRTQENDAILRRAGYDRPQIRPTSTIPTPQAGQSIPELRQSMEAAIGSRP